MMMRVKDPALFAQALAASSVGHNELARKLNRSKGNLGDIKAGRKRVGRDDARVIARTLGVLITDLFDDAPDTRRKKVAA
jgi:ribosome-binding protein aMBF1 (putative translation factor)